MDHEITRDDANGRYVIRAEGEPAGFAAFRTEPGRVVFTHTQVGDEFEGKGIAGALVRGALDDVRERGLSAVPLCPFVKSWIERHPDYGDLVADRRP